MGSDRLLRRPPLKPFKRPATLHPSIFLVFAATVLAAVPPSSAASQIADPSDFHDVYAAHCDGEVFSEYPLSATTPTANDSLASQLRFYGVFASAASKTDDPGDTSASPRRFSFDPTTVYGTSNKDVSKVVGTLKFYGQDLSLFREEGSRQRRMRTFHVRGPRIPVRSGRYRFFLTGFVAESTGKLCMVGSRVLFGNLRSSNVVLKVRYPVKVSINSSFVRGILESLGNRDSKSKGFGRVSLLGLSVKMDYKYSLMEKESGKEGSFASFDNGDDDNLSVFERGGGGSRGWCSAFFWHFSYEMEYGGGCNAVNCNPLGKDALFVPDRIRLSTIQCSDQGKLQLVLSFPNSLNYSDSAFDPRTSLLGEGEWDPKEKRICAVACRVLNYATSLADASVGDCSIKMCMRFPATFSIINRSPTMGQIWSTKAADDSGYFTKIVFRSYDYSLANEKYKYGMMGGSPKSCAQKTEVPKKKAYPMASSTDMRFDIMVTNSKGQTAHGESSPLFVGVSRHQLNFYGYMINENETWLSFQTNVTSTMQNMSYSVKFFTPANYTFGGMDLSYKVVDIFAEGAYDGATGRLCMIGCRRVAQSNTLFANSSLDCNVTINVQFPPLKRKRGEQITGTIKSTRRTSDPLYFESLTLKSNSIYQVQASESIWRMDLEIVLVVVSNTLTCVFVVSQIFHVKRKPDVLPFISIVMLTVVTLGHMIPLLLNFEALFVGNHYQQSSIWRNGGWLEVKEVTVRAVTMVAFLLELRLLQLTWSMRQGEANKGVLWVSEKKVLYASVLLYTVGALVAWFMHQWNHAVGSPILQPGRMLRSVDMVYPVVSSHSLWEDLKSYAGLILDGFLLPQILFNFFVDSNEKALSLFFYVGTTFVRLLPHAYDLYRAHSLSWSADLSYIYASHRMDYYSTTWNIIIPCSGMLFALIVYLQQRFGGCCILPKRFRASMAYEKVPAVTHDDL